MRSGVREFRASIMLAVGAALLLLAGCGPGEAGPRVWIDDPLPGENLPVETIIVRSTSAAEGGVAEARLFVNGEQVRADAPAEEGELVAINQPWEPPGPGSYNLQIEAVANSGTTVRSRTITVTIGGATGPPPTEAPDTEAPSTTSPSPSPTPTPTATPRPPTAPAAISVNFNADSYEIAQGACTTLRWRVENAEEVEVEGDSVAPQDAEEVCPGETTTYQLEAAAGDRQQGAQVTIEVVAPAGPPEAPQGLAVAEHICSSSEYEITLEWEDAAENETGYRIYRGGSQIAELGADATSYTDSPPGNGPHTYGVEALNESGASSRPTVEGEGCLF